MLGAVKKGKKVNEEEMPPPVASGKSSAALLQATDDLPKNDGDQDRVFEEERNEDSATDLKLKDPSDAELPESTPALQGQDVDTGVPGTGTAFKNCKEFGCCPFPYSIFHSKYM